ncbi:lipoprotein [Escherichia coli]|uniref:Lipoprotein n=1 Tax=Escherichia coli TaxID=562 RepID=A0A376LBR3_ECOLX|nr:lipoprotein [Escherichia coli]
MARQRYFGRTIQQGFEAAKNIGTQPVAAQVAAAPAADVAEQPQQQTVDGVASPAQASVSDLTGEQPAAQPVPVSAPAATTAAVSAPANPSAELKIYDTSSQPLSQILNQVQQDGASIVVGPLLKNNVEELLKSNTPLNVLALNSRRTSKTASIFVTSRFHRKTKRAMQRVIFVTRVNKRRWC